MSNKKNQRHVRRSHAHASIFQPQITTSNDEGAPPHFHIRNQRIEHLILEALRSLLDAEVCDPLAQSIWPVSIHLSPDGSSAKVSYAVQKADPSNESAVANQTRTALKRASGFLRARLASSLNLKRTPHLAFVFLGVTSDLSPTELTEGDQP